MMSACPHTDESSHETLNRRTLLRLSMQAAAGLALAGLPRFGRAQTPAANPTRSPALTPKFQISLAAWSVHRLFYAGKLPQIELPKFCREQLDLGGLELVNSFFPSPHYHYCRELLKKAADHDVRILLIMCDAEGNIAAADAAERRQAVRNHRKWLDIAAVLGCHSIRVNTGPGDPQDEDALQRCAESCAALCELARPDKLKVLIENHGGLSSDPRAIVKIIQYAKDPLLGTLPDFGNFPPAIDRYEAVQQLMPYAQAVSAKCHEFDADGKEIRTDYTRMMQVVLDAGYNGWVGIEYEGPDADELAGILKCRDLLRRFQ